MKKIAMLTCLRANRTCTGMSCFKAFYERSRGFARYAGQEVQVAAFMRCNGCDSDPDFDEGIRAKAERLKEENVSAVHLGVCTKKKDGSRCANIDKIVKIIEQQGIEVVDGTHN